MPRSVWSLMLVVLLLSGCGLLPEEDDRTRDWSAQRLYQEAQDAMSVADYELAADYYSKLEARYPFGEYAMQAQINIAYAYYRDGNAEAALAAADRFIRLYPNHSATAYAYYLKGLVNFNRDLGFLVRYAPIDSSQRDAGAALESFADFAELVRKFPDTEYAQDAVERMLFLRNNLARYELHVADYYMDRGAYVSAVNRAQYVIDNYPRTPTVKPALELMAGAYDQLGMPELAADARRVLALNEERGTFAPEPRDDDQTWGEVLWDYLQLDDN